MNELFNVFISDLEKNEVTKLTDEKKKYQGNTN